MNIKAKVNMGHIDVPELHDTYVEGEFELIERPDGSYLVQIILGDYCAAAILDKETFEDALMEDAGMEIIGHLSGNMTLYGDREQDGDDPWERCDECSRKTHPNELELYKGICADCALGKTEDEEEAKPQ